MSYYFEQFEARRPEPPLKHSPVIESIAQVFLLMSLATGGWYILWRWTASLNFDALWFAIPLVVAETGAYIGLVLFSFNMWRTEDVVPQSPPESAGDCVQGEVQKQRLITVDVFFPTYDEDPELVRLSLQDAQALRYPHPVDIRIHVLDDGKRDVMKNVAIQEGCNYITRDSNVGFKAGNLRNAMEQTSGDFIVICDADTRPFPSILENTLGYFRDPDVAWVQTPQWFFDLPAGQRLPDLLHKKIGAAGRAFGRFSEKVFGPIQVGEDPFVNDPKMFYDVIQRRRNWANASFCCGAGSIHRREAVMQVALRQYAQAVGNSVTRQENKLRKITRESDTDARVKHSLTRTSIQDEEFTPYKFHVSEDIYTSIDLHSDQEREWKSVLHPKVESKMLSPQDLLTWTIQRFKYAGGTLDIALHDDFLFRKGLSWKQRMMYISTVWSYLGGIWNVVFLTAPIIFLFFAVAPVTAYSLDFYKHILPFLILTELATMFSLWGLSGRKAKSSYLAFFPINLKALWTVARGEKISFKVTPKERQEGNFLHLVLPQLGVLVLTGVGIVFAWTLFLAGIAIGGVNHTIEGLLINTFWGLNNMLAMSGMVMAAVWKPNDQQLSDENTPDTQNTDSNNIEGGNTDDLRAAA